MFRSRFVQRALRVLVLAALTATPLAPAFAQTDQHFSASCQVVGQSAPEPLGERRGHVLAVSANTCRAEGGPLDGAIATVHTIWELDGPRARLVLNLGVWRKPGALAAFEITQATLDLIDATDASPGGWTQRGRGVFRLASGSLAPLAEREFSYRARSNGMNQFVLEGVFSVTPVAVSVP